MVDQSILERIQKLLYMTVERGCAPSEAAHAAAKVQELLQKHSLSLFDVQAKTYGEAVCPEERDLPFARIPAWVWRLASAVARGSDCDYIVAETTVAGKKINRLRFIGHKSDAQVAAYLYDTLSRRLWEMSAAEGRRHGRTGAPLAKFRWDFMSAAAQEINSRLHREREAFKLSTATAGAMVVVKSGAVQAWMEKAYPDIKRVSRNGPAQLDDHAIQAGVQAGRSIDIRQGIEKDGALLERERLQLEEREVPRPTSGIAS